MIAIKFSTKDQENTNIENFIRSIRNNKIHKQWVLKLLSAIQQGQRVNRLMRRVMKLKGMGQEEDP